MKIKEIYNISLLLIICCLFISSCAVESYTTKKYDADNEILSFISSNDISVRPDTTGLLFIPLYEGVGDMPRKGDIVAFHYKGYYLDGEVFDSSYDRKYPLIVELGSGQMIAGLELALQKMTKTSKAKVVLPFYLAYDDMENSVVPPYSNLVFELELIDIQYKNNE